MNKQIRKYLPAGPRESAFDNDQALISLENTGNNAIQRNEDVLKDLMSGGGWLPRLQLMTANTAKCKSGEFAVNHYALVQGQNFEDLGNQVDVLVIDWRPKALDTSGDNVISSYDHESVEFKSIVAGADEPNSGKMFGAEYLIYIPGKGSFATFFMGTKSARTDIPTVNARLQKAATLKAQKLSNKTNEWFSPLCVPCSTPFDMPDQEELKEQHHKFLNPPKSEVEAVSEDEKADTRER